MNSPEGTFSDRVQQEASDVDDALQSSISDDEAADSTSIERSDTQSDVALMVEQTREVAAAATQYVRDKPLLSLGIAAAVGVVAGLLVRRSH